MSDASTDLVRGHRPSVMERARANYDAAQVDLIRANFAAELTTAQFGLFLEAIARHDLDPFIGEVWPAIIQHKLHIIVGRDGMLRKANEWHTPGHGRFLGMRSDVVREHDYFEKIEKEDGTVWVNHKYRDEKGEPSHGGRDGALRGEVVGAWAVVRREGHQDTYFYAFAKDYVKTKPPWTTHLSAMMQKTPELNALRKAFNIAGVLGETEIDWNPGGALTAPPPGPDYGEDPLLAARLAQLMDLAEWPERKRVVRLAGPDGTGLDGIGRNHLIAELTRDLDAKGVKVPTLDDLAAELAARDAAVDAESEEVAEGEPVTDADVVQEGEPAAA